MRCKMAPALNAMQTQIQMTQEAWDHYDNQEYGEAGIGGVQPPHQGTTMTPGDLLTQE